MAEVLGGPPQRVPIRMRLTLWYIVLMGVTFLLVGIYLTARFHASLLAGVDGSLQLAVDSSLPIIDDESLILAFDRSDYLRRAASRQGVSPTVLRLFSAEGTLLDELGEGLGAPAWPPAFAGFATSSGSERTAWRFLSQPILASDGAPVGWIQAGQPLADIREQLDHFLMQLLWLLPLIILLASAGGYFLAGRMLQPIDQITRAAAEIEAKDLSWRLQYRGAADEIGRLAHTFDHMLARLEVAFERERRFTEDAAHELRTPLAALKGQIDVTLSRPRSQADYHATLQSLAEYVGRLIRLSNALLFFSLSDQRRLLWEPAAVDLGELLEVIVEHALPQADEKQLTVVTELADGLLVQGDTDHLTRLFWNLLDNAVKYTPEGGKLLVRARHERDHVEILLENTGPGIAAEHLPFLFERFYRVASDRSRATGGSGLGLAIAREIVRLHGGTITVESEPGVSTTFSVRLPRAQT